MENMFYNASTLYQDITSWSIISLISSGGMFSGATAWLNRFERDDGSTDGPPSKWFPMPCLADERVQSRICFPCTGGGTKAAGDDPVSGNTGCTFPDRAALKAAVDSCVDATNSDPGAWLAAPDRPWTAALQERLIWTSGTCRK